MPDYDFRVLSPIDFEILTQALLQKELRLRLEAFKAGVDQGVDLRYARNKRHDIIVQCKHYAGSNFGNLRRSVSREIPKVRRLRPDRYLLVTSLPLSLANKQVLMGVSAPFIARTSDIYGREDLNNLLARHKSVERQTFKLWFSSVNVFEEILEKKVKHVSRDALENIRRKARYFVQNPSFEKALRILNKRNVCIIAGNPGIGKTILAEMLLLHFIERRFELVKIESDISEARALDHATVPRVFYYDDFLGQASLSEKLNKNEDQKLIDFLGAIRRSHVSKMILTTREYILNQTRLRYEKIDRSRFNLETCVVDLQEYTRLIRAQILFNHLYFSSIKYAFKKAIVTDPRYLEIIDHENYSPRIIQLMTDPTWLVSVRPSKYVSTFINNLDNPLAIWRHAFEQQLSRGSNVLLCMLTTLPRETALDDVRRAFKVIYRTFSQLYRFDTGPNDFRNVLKELDGNFVRFERDDGKTTVAFHNPSIRDFMQNHLLENEDEVVALVQGAKFFEQLVWLWTFEREGAAGASFRVVLRHNASLFVEALKRTIDLPSYKQRYRWAEGEWRSDPVSVEERTEILASIAQKFTDSELTALLTAKLEQVRQRALRGRSDRRDLARLLERVAGLPRRFNSAREHLIEAATGFFVKPSQTIREFEAYRDFTRHFPYAVDSVTHMQVGRQFETFARQQAPHYDPDAIREYASQVRDLAGAFSINLADAVSEFEAEAKKREKEARRRTRTRRSARRGRPPKGACSDEDIASMFEIFRTGQGAARNVD
jgi:hypothetical protein